MRIDPAELFFSPPLYKCPTVKIKLEVIHCSIYYKNVNYRTVLSPTVPHYHILTNPYVFSKSLAWPSHLFSTNFPATVSTSGDTYPTAWKKELARLQLIQISLSLAYVCLTELAGPGTAVYEMKRG